MGNKEILAKIDAAIKQITVTDLGSSVLTPEKADRFIRVVEGSTPILNEARRYTMTSYERDIDRTGFGARILHVPDDGAAYSDPTFATNKLSVVEVMATIGIKDDALEDNIEKENFENTLIDMIADRAGIDMEELFLKGDTASADTYLALTDGWLKLAANQLDGAAADFDPTKVEDMFQALFDAVPKKYIRDRNQWRIYCSYKIEDDYRDVLRSRGTGLGDTAQTTGQRLYFKGFPVVPVGNMPDGKALLAHPDNLVYGVYRDIRIEPDRMPKLRQTDFVVTMRIDANYEDENAAAAAVGYTG